MGYIHRDVAAIRAAQFPTAAAEPGILDALTETMALILAHNPRPVRRLRKRDHKTQDAGRLQNGL